MGNIKSYNKLSELYADEKVGEQIQQDSDFTIHQLEVVHPHATESPVFRANYYSFVLAENGNSSYTIDGKRFYTKPNTLYFTNPGHLKSFNIKDGIKGFLITVSEDYLKKHIHSTIFDEFGFLLTELVPPCYLSSERFKELKSLSEQILNEHQKTSRLKHKIVSSLFMVFLLKVKEYLMQDESFSAAYNRDSDIVKTFKKDLESNFRDLINGKRNNLNRVQDFAESQQLHPNYFSAVVKSKTGKSANAIIQEKMLTEAQALLVNSKHTVKQIAYKLGYSEPTYFSKVFKKQTGKTPAQYRKSV